MEFKEKQKTLFNRICQLRRNPTKSEEIFKAKLQLLRIKFIFQKAFIKGDYYCIVDFYLPKPYKLCIEIDGGYHFSESQRIKDNAKDQYLKSRNFNVLRLTNDAAEYLELESIKILIEKSAKSAA